MTVANGRELVRVGEMVKAATREQAPQIHPDHPWLIGPTIALLSGALSGPHADLRNAVVGSTEGLDWRRPDTCTGAPDRFPCGTGTSAEMACLHARGELASGQDFCHEGVLQTVFTGWLMAETKVHGSSAVGPRISGRAWVTGHARWVLDPDAHFPEEYKVGDIWGSGASNPGPPAPAPRGRAPE